MAPLAAALSLALGCCGCGPPPPQLPAAQANRVGASVTGIMAACGEAYQRRAFAPASPDRGALRDAATLRGEELADVYREMPQHVYYGITLQELVALSLRALRECGLQTAAAALQRQAR